MTQMAYQKSEMPVHHKVDEYWRRVVRQNYSLNDSDRAYLDSLRPLASSDEYLSRLLADISQLDRLNQDACRTTALKSEFSVLNSERRTTGVSPERMALIGMRLDEICRTLEPEHFIDY